MKTQEWQSGIEWRLIGSRRSPYVRKVLVFAAMTGQLHRIGLMPITVSFRETDAQPLNPNPLNQVPTLDAGSGLVLYDSFVICDWMAAQSGPKGVALIDGTMGRHDVLTRHAFAQSLTDLAIKLYSERKRGPDGTESAYGNAYRIRMGHGLDALEKGVASWSADFDLGQIATAVMLAYLDFRHESVAWREGRPALKSWFERVVLLPSMQETEYQG